MMKKKDVIHTVKMLHLKGKSKAKVEQNTPQSIQSKTEKWAL